MNIFGMGGMEILVILLIAFLVVGPSKMVSMSRKMGKTFSDLRRSTSNLSDMVIEAEDEDGEGKKQMTAKRDAAAPNTNGTSPSGSASSEGPVPFQRGGQNQESEGKAPPSTSSGQAPSSQA
jgi:Sec-independent protein translocase protein TatA